MEVDTKMLPDGDAMAIETTKETAIAATIVNRIPASSSSRKHPRHQSHHHRRPSSARSSMKRRGSFGSKQESRASSDGSGSQDREASSSTQRGSYRASSPKRCKPMDLEEVFERLDPNHPDQARRIFQRRKMLQKGKNTLGYQNYLRQVPKGSRLPRSMKTPGTPDPSLKISAKRWQGLVKAWRIALHEYDPPDMMMGSGYGDSIEGLEDDETTENRTAAGDGADSGTGAASARMGLRAQELEKAAAMGLVVEAGDEPPPSAVASPMAGVMGLDSDDDEDDEDAGLDASSPISVLTEGSLRRRRLSLDTANIRDGRNSAENEVPAAPARLVVARRRWADEDSSDDDDELL